MYDMHINYIDSYIWLMIDICLTCVQAVEEQADVAGPVELVARLAPATVVSTEAVRRNRILTIVYYSMVCCLISCYTILYDIPVLQYITI